MADIAALKPVFFPAAASICLLYVFLMAQSASAFAAHRKHKSQSALRGDKAPSLGEVKYGGKACWRADDGSHRGQLPRTSFALLPRPVLACHSRLAQRGGQDWVAVDTLPQLLPHRLGNEFSGGPELDDASLPLRPISLVGRYGDRLQLIA